VFLPVVSTGDYGVRRPMCVRCYYCLFHLHPYVYPLLETTLLRLTWIESATQQDLERRFYTFRLIGWLGDLLIG